MYLCYVWFHWAKQPNYSKKIKHFHRQWNFMFEMPLQVSSIFQYIILVIFVYFIFFLCWTQTQWSITMIQSDFM